VIAANHNLDNSEQTVGDITDTMNIATPSLYRSITPDCHRNSLALSRVLDGGRDLLHLTQANWNTTLAL
jgi:hypothetical protein